MGQVSEVRAAVVLKTPEATEVVEPVSALEDRVAITVEAATPAVATRVAVTIIRMTVARVPHADSARTLRLQLIAAKQPLAT